MPTLYASFADPTVSERAAGALLDHGARAEDITLLWNDKHEGITDARKVVEATSLERSAKSGISVTTGQDAAAGMAKGSAIGLGLGALALAAALFIPGVGLVVGGGAFAMALAGAAGTVAAGATVGAVGGYLKDQGLPETYVSHFSETFSQGGSILAIAVPSGEVSAELAEQILAKYNAVSIATNNDPNSLMDSPAISGVTPDTILNEGRSSNPIVTAPIGVPVIATSQVTTMGTQPAAAGFGLADVVPLESDPITGTMTRGYVVDPVTGARRTVQVVNGSIIYAD